MIRKGTSLLSVLALMALLSFPAFAQQSPTRPFLLTGFGHVTPNGGTPPVACNIAIGDGQATHLGEYQYVQNFCVDRSTFPWKLTGQLVMTAANGDTLTSDNTGTVMPELPFSGIVQIYVTVTFTGGTGRFANATGSGVLSGPGNVIAGTAGPVHMEGTISY